VYTVKLVDQTSEIIYFKQPKLPVNRC